MKELVKAKIRAAVEKIVRTDSNIGRELIDTYKDLLIESTCDIFAALSDMYDTEEEMAESIEAFIKGNFEDKEKFNPKGYNTDSYMVAMVPVLIPIEAIAMLDKMDDVSLPLVLSHLSGSMMRTIMEIQAFDKLGDKLLEKESTRIADVLKEKGWVA